MHRSLAALTVLAALVVPVAPAVAQPNVTIQPFGDRTGTISFTTQPLGQAECNTPIPLRFTNLTTSMAPRFLDFWRASSGTAGCEVGTTRGSTTSEACTYVPTEGNSFTNALMWDMDVTAAELFGSDACEGVTTTNTFYVFDSQSARDTSSPFSTWASLTITIDTDAPSAPSLGSGIAGDTTVTVGWTNPSDIGTQGGIRVYFDPNGCGGDGGTSALVAGGTPPASLLVHEQLSQSITSTTVSTGSFGWAGSYGQTGAIAVSVLDNALNPSPLSNVVCAQHVQVTGFWDQYCSGLQSPDGGALSMAECTAHYRGCSVAVPSRRTDLGMLAVLSLALGLFVRRRSR